MYKKILDHHGLIISEYSPDTKCQSQYFLERNRIISGLSLGVLVIEAVHRSGTSVTAKLAILQDRKVFALPHEIWNSHGLGTNALIKKGAILVTNTEDILKELNTLKKLSKNLNTIQRLDLNSLYSDYDIFNPVKNDSASSVSTNISSNISANGSTSVSSNAGLQIHSHNTSIIQHLHSNNLEKKILKDTKLAYLYDLISLDPISMNELCKKTSKPISRISNDLFLLELKGYIKKVAGGYICILNK